MINLGTTDFYIAVQSMPQTEFESYSTKLFDDWEKYVEQTLKISDYSLSLTVEEGSVKGRGLIGAGLVTVYLGISGYGSFFAGLQTIREQVNGISEYLSESAKAPFHAPGVNIKTKKHGGVPASLHRLFVKVQRGDLTPQEAMLQAEILLGDETSTAPGFMKDLNESLSQAPRFHQQLALPLQTDESEDELPTSQRSRLPRSSPAKPDLPPPLQFRVEVWRESKNTKRNVRVSQL